MGGRMHFRIKLDFTSFAKLMPLEKLSPRNKAACTDSANGIESFEDCKSDLGGSSVTVLTRTSVT
jgi:hypothetical protein